MSGDDQRSPTTILIDSIDVDGADIDRLAHTADMLETAATGETRRDAIRKIIGLFKLLNLTVIAVVGVMLIADWAILAWVSDSTLKDRIIDQTVVMALIGATVVQLGTVMLTLSKHLFPASGE